MYFLCSFFYFWLIGVSVGKQVWPVCLGWARQFPVNQSAGFPGQLAALHLGWWFQHDLVNVNLCPEASTTRENCCRQSWHHLRQCWFWISHWPGLCRFPGFRRACSWGPFSWQVLSVVRLRCDGQRFLVDYPAHHGCQSQVDVQEWRTVAKLHEEGHVVLSWPSFLDTAPRVLWHGSRCSWPLRNSRGIRLGAV